MHVLVTFAVDAEFAPWRKLGEFRVADPVLDAYETTVGDAKVCVVLTGVGCKRAWDVTAISLWGEHPFDVCISSGLAGALRPEHKPGDVLVAREIRDFKSQRPLSCDPALVQLAGACGAKIVGAFYTGDRILARAQQKQELGASADAVEMESRRVLEQGRSAGWRARCVAIRAISDGVEEDLPLDFNVALTPDGDVSGPRMVAEIFRRPWILPRLIRFGRQSRRAAQSLALFLDRYIMALENISAAPDGAALEEVSAT